MPEEAWRETAGGPGPPPPSEGSEGGGALLAEEQKLLQVAHVGRSENSWTKEGVVSRTRPAVLVHLAEMGGG